MRITIGGIQPVTRDPAHKDDDSPAPPAPRARERRKNRADRRKSVRDGVIVRLSFKKERRSGVDRRRRDDRP